MDTTAETLYQVPVTTMNNETTTLGKYNDQVLLIVNVASRCGFTPQYAQLEQLYSKYKDRGFAILGFPCDQFMHQEPGNNDEIQAFAESCYRITFPLFAKIDVKGKNQAPLYAYIKKNLKKRPLKFIPWNFSKILIDRKGNVLKQFLPTTSFTKIRNEIEGLL
ncbi:glutathione peroxidase [Legionella dresdenensis]|uniref:Glutathione peroxidase n=1 Tax=Legionella dresdenensis TaxID=450200 RepID=A0ABV8CDD6_9GAMM